jgi:sarcosine oxidase subunit delta
MKLVPCPLNGPRPMEEFVYGGEVRTAPEPDAADDASWARHVYHRQGVPATRQEWWYHQPSGYWFIALRDTASGEFLDAFDAIRGPTP